MIWVPIHALGDYWNIQTAQKHFLSLTVQFPLDYYSFYLCFTEYVSLYINSERHSAYSTIMSTGIGAVNCDIEGVPTPTYTWSKEGQMYDKIKCPYNYNNNAFQDF